MKGIILAAGKGTRLYPMTLPVCKPLLPVYDKPMIYYPLSVLILAGIRDILIIIPPDEEAAFRHLLGDGSQIGVNITYAKQYVARGIADAFLVGEDFIGDDRVCLALGDNIFFSRNIKAQLQPAVGIEDGAVIFGYYVDDPRPFGVAEFDESGKVISLEEKPQIPKSNYIVPGLYFYDSSVVSLAKTLKPSARGELEITDLNTLYMRQNKLQIVLLDKQFLWLDAGTADNLLMSAEEIRKAQKTNGLYIGCIEAEAMKNGFISAEECRSIGQSMASTAYGQYLIHTADIEEARART